MPFYNFSNHPSALWPAEQKAAAAELCGDDQIVDVLPGEVPPEWDDGLVYGRAQELIQNSGLLNTPRACAMVATEATLAYTLVLQLTGIEGDPAPGGYRAFAATTRRESVEEPQPDGSVRKTNVFRFVRFREY